MTLYMPLFRSCTNLKKLKQLHSYLLTTDLHRDPLASTKLIETYFQMGCFNSARLTFETFTKPDSFMWGVVIKCYVWASFFQEALSLYDEMIYQNIQISSFAYPSILRASAGLRTLRTGEKLHERIIKCGLDPDPVIQTSLLHMYGELGSLCNARKLFVAMRIRDVVVWSSIILIYVENGLASEGLEMFRWMVREKVEPDSVTMLSVAEACAELGFLASARSVHGYRVRREIQSNGLDNSLIVMYSKCGDLSSAERVFDKVSNPSTSSWTSLMACYNKSGRFREAISIFMEMVRAKVAPNSVTILTLLISCAELLGWLREGKSIHSFVIRNAIDPDLEFLGASLIEFYADCKMVGYCKKVFELIREKSILSWNVLISVYAQKGLLNEALMHFVWMRNEGLFPDSFTLSSALSASGNLGFSQFGYHLHVYMIKTGFSNEFVQNSLIDMYFKCGLMDEASKAFDETEERSVVTWNTIICGLSSNGNSVEAIAVFDEMFSNSLDLNEITFLSVLQACSNLGYLEKGKWVHHKLIAFGIRKDTFVETALTDMYAKCGHLWMAQSVFDSMPERTMVSWSVMISGYGRHGRIDDAISLFNQMVVLGIKPNEVTFMNILSACSHSGRIKEGKFYFNMMRECGIEANAEHYACVVDLLSRAGDLDGAYQIINSIPCQVDASMWGSLLNGCRIHGLMDNFQSIQRSISRVNANDTGFYSLLSNIYAGGGNWDKSRNVKSTMDNMGLKKTPGCSEIHIGGRIHQFGSGEILN